MRLITAAEYLMGRAKPADLSAELLENMNDLLVTVNSLLEEFGEYRKVNSGYRRPVDNAACGGGKSSAHLTCQAVDLEDKDGRLKAFCTKAVLEKYNLYREDSTATPSWAHLQTRPTRSGNRIFVP